MKKNTIFFALGEVYESFVYFEKKFPWDSRPMEALNKARRIMSAPIESITAEHIIELSAAVHAAGKAVEAAEKIGCTAWTVEQAIEMMEGSAAEHAARAAYKMAHAIACAFICRKKIKNKDVAYAVSLSHSAHEWNREVGIATKF